MDEREAIQRLKRGDISGLEALVRRYQLAAVRAAYLVTRERALAEDVVQSAFLKVYDCIDRFDAARPFGAWFYTTILRDAIKAARQRARASPIDRLREFTEPSDPGDGPEHALERAETADEVAAALAQLAEAEVPNGVNIWPAIERAVATRQTRRRVPPRLAITASAAAALVLVAITFVNLPVGTVNAESLMDRAQAATTAVTYHMLLTRQPVAKTGDITSAEVWYAGADRQRSTQQTRDASGAISERSDWVFNGADAWLATTKDGHTTVIHSIGTEWTRPADDPSATRNLLDAFQHYSDAKACLTAQIVPGEATVAGRGAYIVDATPKPNCQVAGGAVQMQAWIDTETYLPLKTEVRDPSGKLLDQSEVTSLQTGIAIPDATFAYVIPSDAEVHTVSGGTGADVKRALAGPSNEPMSKPKR